MKKDLNGRLALVTGSSHGLGLEIARILAEQGARILITGRDAQHLAEACEIINFENLSNHEAHLTFEVDSARQESVKKMFERFADHGKYSEKFIIDRLDILVNNIGGAPKFGKFEDLTDEDWQNTLDLNVMSAVRFTRAALPLLRKSKYGGRIINIGSLPAIQPGKFNPDYAVAKAGVINLTKCLANEFGPEGIQTNCICPNTLNGGGMERNAKDRAKNEGISAEEARKKILESAAKKNPLGKVGELSYVANAVAFLVSDAAQFINGTCMRVDGGECRSI